MSLNPDIRDQAYQFFTEEARELLQVLEEGLLDLREDHSTAKVHDLMRAAHSIKGGAASVELTAIETLAHRLEDFFKALYSDNVKIDDELEGLLLQGYDCLRNPLLQQIETGTHNEQAAILNAEPIFSALKLRLGEALKDSDSYIPNANDLGVDIVASIFKIDVLQIIEHLKEVLHHDDNYNLEAELRSQLDVCSGFAELFRLPGFGDIVSAALTALDNYPDRAREIIELTIADWSAARDAVLAGDRERGGEVSQQLLALSQKDSAAAEPDNSLDDLLNFDVETADPESDLDWDLASVFEPADLESDLEQVFGEFGETETNDKLGIEAPPTESFSSDRNWETAFGIDAALKSIDDIYEHLPAVDDDTFQAPNSAKPNQAKPSSERVSSNLSVRVALNRLEKMNKLVGELTIERNSLALQNQQMQNTIGELTKKLLYLQKVTGKLWEFPDLMLLNTKTASSEKLPSVDLADLEFDPLEMDRYNILYSLLQEILETTVRLEEDVDNVAIFARQSGRAIDVQGQMLSRVRNELIWARMLPLEQILQRFPRTLRDLSHKYHKPVELKLTGTGVLVDKAVLEKLYDPLLHLLRNSFDHGIEPPEVRRQRGKPETGTIEIHAYYRGDRTIIDVSDDGKGLDLAKISQTAIELGLLTAERAKNASKEEIYNLIFTAGFSTNKEVSELSGRGIGMNVVRSQIETLKGKIAISSKPGAGTTFSLRLPLTLTITKLLICSLGKTALAIPSESIVDIIIPDSERIKVADKQRFLLWNQTLIPVLPLAKMLPYNCPISSSLNSKVFETIAPPQDWALPLLLVQRGEKFFALEIERAIGERELAIEPFNCAIAPPSYIYGCSILSDGTLIPVFDGQTLIDVLVGTQDESDREFSLQVEPTATVDFEKFIEREGSSQVAPSKTVMIVDDSSSLRRTMALSLTKHGYSTIQCQDGKQALEEFRLHPNIDLIICDIEMPVMNGFEFLEMRRRDSKLAKIPVIMLTSRSGSKQRNLAMQLGANGYFIKPYIEQEFLIEIDGVLQTKDDNSTELAATPTSKITKKTVLIIDDSSSLRRTMALSLENNDYEVLQARDGREGLEVLMNNLQIALVICDVEMPNMNGFEFLSERRQHPELLKIPVAMLTSRNGEKHRGLAEQLGANAYFSKPYIEPEFLAEIERILSS